MVQHSNHQLVHKKPVQLSLGLVTFHSFFQQIIMEDHLLLMFHMIVIVTNLFFSFQPNQIFSSDVKGVSASNDDDIYQKLGLAYITQIMTTNTGCPSGLSDRGYVVQGATWYEITGGMQDYGYFNYGTIELTMEISCCKYPGSNLLENYWNYNRDAMVELLYQAQRG